jgi:hypothetical protein
MADITPIGEVFVVSDTNTGGNTGGLGGGGVCQSIIGFDNTINISTVTGDAADSLYPFTNALDYRDNTQYSPSSSSGSVIIEFRQSAPVTIDYIGVALHNGRTAGLVGKLELLVNGAWTEVANFTPLADKKTMCRYFEAGVSQRQRLTLTFTSKLYIGVIYLGKAMRISRTPDIGFIPADTNNVDEVKGFVSNTGQRIIGRRKSVGYEQSGSFDLINYEEIKPEFVKFQDHVKDSKPFFMVWNVRYDQSIFGSYKNPNNMRPLVYNTNQTTTFEFEMVGDN